MTAFNTDHTNTELLDQELTDDQLEAVAGGGFWKDVVNGVVGFTPLGPINRISGAFGGPTMGDLVE